MSNRYLARLRLARVRCNKNIARLESLLAFQRSSREAIEAAIHTWSRSRSCRRRTGSRIPYSPAMGITRLALDVLRDAGEPLGVAEIAVRVLAVKRLPLPAATDQEDDAGAIAGRVHGAGEA